MTTTKDWGPVFVNMPTPRQRNKERNKARIERRKRARAVKSRAAARKANVETTRVITDADRLVAEAQFRLRPREHTLGRTARQAREEHPIGGGD